MPNHIDTRESLNVMHSYHGVAERLDRLPMGSWQSRMLWLFGGAAFCACMDIYSGGSVLATLYEQGWASLQQNALFASVSLAAYALGSLLVGFFADRAGRRAATLLSMIIVVFSSFCAVFAPNMTALTVIRAVMGIGIGAFLPVAYGSLCEYVVPARRGVYGSWLGFLSDITPVVASVVVILAMSTIGWRVVFLVVGIVGAVMWVLLWRHMPESPRWLASQGRIAEAEETLDAVELRYRKLGFELSAIDTHMLAEKVSVEELEHKKRHVFSGKEMIRRVIVLSAVLIAMNLMMYTITSWTQSILIMRGFDASLSIGATTVMLLGAPFGIFLLVLTADRIERRSALTAVMIATALVGYIWSIISSDQLIIVALVGFLLSALLFYFSVLAFGVYAPELFPTEIRVRGVGLVSAIGRIPSIAIPWIVTSMVSESGPAAYFLLLGVIVAILALVVAVFGVETKDKSLEEINDPIHVNRE